MARIAMLQLWFNVHMLRQNGRLINRLNRVEDVLPAGLETYTTEPSSDFRIGAIAPGFALPDQAGVMVTLDSLRGRLGTLLLFSDPNCGPCKRLLTQIPGLQIEFSGLMSIVVIMRGGTAPVIAHDEVGSMTILIQQAEEVANSYRVSVTPSAIYIRPDNTIGSYLATGPESIVQMLQSLKRRFPREHISAAPNDASKRAIGQPAPIFSLPDKEGVIVSLAQFRRRYVLLLFWNPRCGFCVRMLPELLQWTVRPDANVLVIASGTAADNRQVASKHAVLLDDGSQVSSMFGSNSTPSAILIDPDGKIASGIAVGSGGIQELLQSLQTMEYVG